MYSHLSSLASGDHHVARAAISLATTNKPEPTLLHNVDIYIWEISCRSATALQGDDSSPFVTFVSSPSTTDSGTSPQLQQPHQSPIEGTDRHHSVSPTTCVMTDSGMTNSPTEDVLPVHTPSTRHVLTVAGRRNWCPECRAYTSKRSFNMKRHQKACQKRATSSQSKAAENPRSRGSGETPFRD
ncbi:hypothetical protein LB504_004447 [Fusarium proliferatum]|nr:hypothetical protein LB504_004447 [Fusarium proliferatum]